MKLIKMFLLLILLSSCSPDSKNYVDGCQYIIEAWTKITTNVKTDILSDLISKELNEDIFDYTTVDPSTVRFALVPNLTDLGLPDDDVTKCWATGTLIFCEEGNFKLDFIGQEGFQKSEEVIAGEALLVHELIHVKQFQNPERIRDMCLDPDNNSGSKKYDYSFKEVDSPEELYPEEEAKFHQDVWKCKHGLNASSHNIDNLTCEELIEKSNK